MIASSWRSPVASLAGMEIADTTRGLWDRATEDATSTAHHRRRSRIDRVGLCPGGRHQAELDLEPGLEAHASLGQHAPPAPIGRRQPIRSRRDADCSHAVMRRTASSLAASRALVSSDSRSASA